MVFSLQNTEYRSTSTLNKYCTVRRYSVCLEHVATVTFTPVVRATVRTVLYWLYTLVVYGKYKQEGRGIRLRGVASGLSQVWGGGGAWWLVLVRPWWWLPRAGASSSHAAMLPDG